MKVLLVNGSSKKKGCTATALAEVEQELNREGIETVWFHVGSQTVRGCIGCEQCHKARKGECVFGDEDGVNELISLAEECDGFVFGSPVHFAALSGSITSLLDRVFYASSKSFYYKPAACLVSCRRAGSTAALEQLLKYPSFARMPVVSSQYWNMVSKPVSRQGSLTRNRKNGSQQILFGKDKKTAWKGFHAVFFVFKPNRNRHNPSIFHGRRDRSKNDILSTGRQPPLLLNLIPVKQLKMRWNPFFP